MAREKRLELVITGDARKAQKALNDLDAAAGKSQKATGKALDGIKGKMLDLGVAAGLYSATQSASDLGEALNVTGLIFRDARGEIDEFVKSSTELGFSETQARELTASIGGLLDNVGLAQDETVKWSKDLLELGADMGSAFNEDPADAVAAIGAAVRGETEPIRRYNVMLDDASVRAKAVEMGLAATTSEVDKAGKAQATLALIMEQTDAVQGDFRNTSDGLANQQRIMAAEFENAKAKLGAGLLPVMTGAVGVAADLAGGFADLDGWQQKLILGTGAGAYAWLRWGDQIGNVASLMGRGVGDGRAYVSMIAEATRDRAAGVSRTRAALDAMNDSMGSSIKQTGYFTSGLAAAAAGVAAFGATMSILDELSDFDGDLSQLSDDLRLFAKGSGDSDLALQELGVSTDELAKSFKMAFSNSSYLDRGIGLLSGGIVGDTPEEINKAQNRIDALDDALAMLVQQGHPAEAEEAFARIKTELEAQGVATEDVVGYLDDYAEALDRSKRDALTAGGVVDQVTGQLGDLGGEAAGTADDLDDAAEKAKKADRWLGDLTPTVEDSGDAFKVAGERVRGYYDEMFAPLTANLDAEEALDNLTASVIENGRSLNTSTDEGRANIRALTDYVTASAMAATQTDNSAASMASYRQRLIELLGDLRYTKDEVNNLFTILGLAPDDILLNFTTNAEDAKRKVKEYGDTLWGLQGQIHTQWVIDIAGTAAGFLGLGGGGGGGFLGLDITPRRTSAGPTIAQHTPPRAAGGPVQGDHWYRVNERGQEFFRPDRSGSVIPVGGFGGRTSSAAAGGGVVVNVHVAGSVVAERDLVASITSAVSRKGRSDGTLGFRVPVTDVTGVPGFVS